jgi:uncharacterized membrane protein YcaP (DUF421 family)
MIVATSTIPSAGEYTSIADGIVLVATIIFWNYALDWLSFKFDWFGRLVEPPPLPLVRNGRLLRRNMRLELIKEDELMMELRQQGLDDISKVKIAYIESDGRISVIQYESRQHEKSGRKKE